MGNGGVAIPSADDKGSAVLLFVIRYREGKYNCRSLGFARNDKERVVSLLVIGSWN
jgi:hypothetical protein